VRDLKKIAVINDLSGLGKCSLTAAIPVISAMGVQAVPLPTAILSNQTGYASCFWDDYTDRMERIMDEWEKRQFHPDGIYTGFLAGEEQAKKILEFFRRFCKKETKVLVDPVMGDQGKVYGIFSPALLEAMRVLSVHADIITPNLTEALLLLYGKKGMERCWEGILQSNGNGYQEEIEKTGLMLAEQLQIETVVITGIDFFYGKKTAKIGNLIVENREVTWIFSEKTGGSYSGTGDLFASVLIAGIVRGISVDRCVEKAVDFLSKAIRDAVEEGQDRNDGVCFETYLHELWRK
jgi:pyridoxine kinase